MSTTGHRLSRRYRRLLLCYPRAYRRERGDEIVNTLLELAPPERNRPTVREAANLIRHGLRCRLGRPASRSVVVWAAVAAAICGLFTAAVATRAAWETARPIDRAEATAILAAILPEHNLGNIDAPAALFEIFGEPLSLDNVDVLLTDGSEYQLSTVRAGATGTPPVDQQQTLSLTQERLRANGWRVYEPIVSNMVDCADARCDPTNLPKQTRLIAGRSDIILEIVLNSPRPRPLPSDIPVSQTYLSVELRRATPPAVHGAGIAGGLFGAIAGWLLFGWASRRTDHRPPGLRTAAAFLYTTTMILWWMVPTLPSMALVLMHHLGEPHPQWHPLWEWFGQPFFLLPFLMGCTAALLGIVIAALPSRETGHLPISLRSRSQPGPG